MKTTPLESIALTFEGGNAIPYLGPGVLALDGAVNRLPGSPLALAGRLTANSSVPYKIKTNLTAAAQFIENFKHRKTVSNAMTEAFGAEAQPTSLHTMLARVPCAPARHRPRR